MSIIIDLMQQSWVYSLGWTLVHSLWQSAFVAASCATLLFFAKNASANFRYMVALVGVLGCFLASAATFYHYQFLGSERVSSVMDAEPLVQAGVQDTGFDMFIYLGGYMNTITLLWLVGFTLYAIKAAVEYSYCQRIKNTNLVDTPEKWQRIFAALCKQVGIKTLVELRVSRLISMPCVIGHLKPVVLMPLGLLLSMNQQQIEAILLHELGHVRRNDYLLAMLQAVIKSLFFFNPFLLWISNQMDKEREHACDDIAVSLSQDPLLFANTLKEFADMNSNLKPAMNIHNDKLLLNRITRLFNKPTKTSNAKNSLLATLLVVMTGGVVSLCVNANPGEPEKTVILSSQAMPIATAYSTAIAQINQACGTNEKFTGVKRAGTRFFNMSGEPMSCTDAIRLIKKSMVLDNIHIPDGTKKIDMFMTSRPIGKALADVNRQCGTSESIAANISNDLITLNFKEIDCISALQIIKDYEP